MIKAPKSNLFQVTSEWIPPSTFPNLKNAKTIAVDLETCDTDLMIYGPGYIKRNGYVTGIAIATADFTGYFPIAHEGGGNLDKEKVIKWVKETLSTTADKVFHNAPYDIGWLKTLGIEVQGRIIDTMIAACLVDENKFSYKLDSLSRFYLNISKSEALLVQAASDWGIDPKKEMYKLPSQFVGEYAEKDAELTLKLWNVLEVELTKQELVPIFELELDVLKIIMEMKQKGVRVDVNGAEKMKKDLHHEEQLLLQEIKKLTGINVEIWAAKSVALAFDAVSVKYKKTPTGLPSFTKNFLSKAAHTHKLPNLIVTAREINKARTTFIDTILKHQYRGRIHSEIHQLRGEIGGTITGRLSYSNPNLQQIPARHKDIGPRIRSLFLPEEKEQWAIFDYSQQEPRLIVHYASVVNEGDGLYGVHDVVDEYKKKNIDFHKIVADMAEIPRSQAKTINLALFYGMGKGKLMDELGVNQEKAEELLQNYNKKVPFVKELARLVTSTAEDFGKIKTILNRSCRFDKWESRTWNERGIYDRKEAEDKHGKWNIKRAFTYKALNKLIQGSAADQTKKSMVDLHKKGFLPLIQVHDELDVSVKNENEIKQIKEIMENAVELSVPSVVDYNIGKTWGAAYEKKGQTN